MVLYLLSSLLESIKRIIGMETNHSTSKVFLVESRSDGLYYVYVYGLWRGKSKSQVRKATTSTFQTDFFIHLLCPPVHMARKKSTPKTPSSEPLFGPGGSEDRARSNSSGYLSDIFSEFTKHITPAFNHERPDR